MTSKEAAQARQRLGLSVEDLAAEFALTPPIVQAWEAGTVGVPKKVGKDLRWRVALLDRDEALAKSGLPDCEWMVAWDAEDVPDDTEALSAQMERAEAHWKTCGVCKARKEFIDEHFGEMPKPPIPGGAAVIIWISTRVEKLPSWAQPAVWVGIAFGAYSLLRVFFFLPAILRDPGVALAALGGLAASVAIGASLGLVYGAFQQVRAKWARRTA